MSQDNIETSHSNRNINSIPEDNGSGHLDSSQHFSEVTEELNYQAGSPQDYRKQAFDSLTGGFFKTNVRGRIMNRMSILMEIAFAMFVSKNGSEGPKSIMKGAGYKNIHPVVAYATDGIAYALGAANLYSDTQAIDINEEADEAIHEKPKKQVPKQWQLGRDIYTFVNQALAFPHFLTGALADVLGTSTVVEKITGNFYGQLAANGFATLFYGIFGTNYYYMAFKHKFEEHTDALFDAVLNPREFAKIVKENKLKAIRVLDQALNNAIYRGVSFAFILKAWLGLMNSEKYEDVAEQLVWDMFVLSIWVVLHHRTLNVVNSLFGEFKILQHKDFENLETSSLEALLETGLEGIRALAIGYLTSQLFPIPYAFPQYAVPSTVAMLAFGAGYKVTSEVRLQRAALNRLKADQPQEYKKRIDRDAGNESGYDSEKSLVTVDSSNNFRTGKYGFNEHSDRFKELASEKYLTTKLKTVNFLFVLGGRIIRSASYYQMVEVVTPDLGLHLYFMGKVCFAVATGLPVSYNEGTLFGPMVDANTPRVSLKHDLLWFRDAQKYVTAENNKLAASVKQDNGSDNDLDVVKPLIETAKLKNYHAGFFKEVKYWNQAYWTKGSADFSQAELDAFEDFLADTTVAQRSMV